MDALNTVILSLNSKYIHSSLAPWCLLAGIREHCRAKVNATVVEGTVNEDISRVLQRVVDCAPDVVGICCYIWNIEYVKRLAVLLKSSLPDVVIVLGGPQVSYEVPEAFFDVPQADYIIRGEGEYPFAVLLDSLATGGQIPENTGICIKNGGDFVTAPPYLHDNEPPSPYCEEYFDSLCGRMAYLETSRGCPFSCAFCLSGGGRGVQFFDISRAKQEIIALANSGTKTVKFVDRTFNADKRRAAEIFSFIISNIGGKIPHEVCFHFEIAGDILSDELISLLAKAPRGSIQLEIGLQSFNEKTLSFVNRRTDTARLTENLQRLISAGNMHIHVDLIAGLPFEDIGSFAESFNKAYVLSPHMLQLGFLKLIPGCTMRTERDRYPCEFNRVSPYEVISTPWLSAEELHSLHLAEASLERIYNSGRLRQTAAFIMEELGLTPFEFYMKTGAALESISGHGISFNEYVAALHDHYSRITNARMLRDVMVCDVLSAVANRSLPPVLRVEDSAAGKIKALLNNDPQHKRRPGVIRGFALLYTQKRAVYVDYTNRDPVTGKYRLIDYIPDEGL